MDIAGGCGGKVKYLSSYGVRRRVNGIEVPQRSARISGVGIGVGIEGKTANGEIGTTIIGLLGQRASASKV